MSDWSTAIDNWCDLSEPEDTEILTSFGRISIEGDPRVNQDPVATAYISADQLPESFSNFETIEPDALPVQFPWGLLHLEDNPADFIRYGIHEACDVYAQIEKEFTRVEDRYPLWTISPLFEWDVFEDGIRFAEPPVWENGPVGFTKPGKKWQIVWTGKPNANVLALWIGENERYGDSVDEVVATAEKAVSEARNFYQRILERGVNADDPEKLQYPPVSLYPEISDEDAIETVCEFRIADLDGFEFAEPTKESS